MKRALVVEDTPAHALVLESVLLKLGFSVTYVENGKAAFELLTASGNPAYDLIITDAVMPQMSGVDLVYRLQQFHCPIPVILISARTAPKDIEAFMRAGASGFVPKPLQVRSLTQAIEETMAKVAESASLTSSSSAQVA